MVPADSKFREEVAWIPAKLVPAKLVPAKAGSGYGNDILKNVTHLR